MIGSIRVAAMQLRAHDRSDFPDSLERIIELVRLAAEHADLVVLPEATFPAYVLGAAPVEDAAIAESLNRLRDVATATRTVIVAGAAASKRCGRAQRRHRDRCRRLGRGARGEAFPVALRSSLVRAGRTHRADCNRARRARRADLRRRTPSDDRACARRSRRAGYWSCRRRG